MRTSVIPWFRPGGASVLAVVALLTWSSWSPPSLHEYAAPMGLALLATPTLHSNAEAQRLQALVAAIPGVTACAVRPAKQLLTVTYNAEHLTAAQLCRHLGLRALPTASPAPAARQCPVPAGYVLALEHLRFSLNLRRLWVKL